MNASKDSSKMHARWAGFCLLLTLAGLVATLSIMPSFDARAEYFGEWFPGLVTGRFRFGVALGLAAVTGIIVMAAGLALHSALRTVRTQGAAIGFVFVISGAGFLMSAVVGVPALMIMMQAARSTGANLSTFAQAALPWAAGNQAALIMFGLGGFAAGLLATALVMINAGGISRWIALLFALAPVIPLAVFLIIPGEDPLIWLSVGLPSLVWSIGLAGYLAITGRVTQAF